MSLSVRERESEPGKERARGADCAGVLGFVALIPELSPIKWYLDQGVGLGVWRFGTSLSLRTGI